MFRIFISHSVEDMRVVYELARTLQLKGIEAIVAEWEQQPGTLLALKIGEMIDKSDCVLALLTKNGGRSIYVNQEIGYARKAGKLIIPVIEYGVEKGFLEGLEYILFKRDDPYDAISKTVNYLKTIEIRKSEEERNKVILAGVILFLGLIALLSEEK